MSFNSIFFWLGTSISKNPIIVIITTLIIMLTILSGLIFINFELSPQNLWLSENSISKNQHIFFEKKFGKYFRTNQIIYRPKDENNKNDIFTKEIIEKLYYLQNNISTSKIEFNNKNWTINDLCYKPISEKGCLILSPMNLWKNNLTSLKNTKNIKEIANCIYKMGENTIPCLDDIGIPIQFSSFLGKENCKCDLNITNCILCNKTAEALSITYLLINNFYVNKISEIWEENMKNLINEFNKKENELNTNYRADFILEKSISDNLKDESKVNIFMIIISYSIMFIYIILSMGKFPSLIYSKILVGLTGIIIIILSFLGSFSIVSFLGYKLNYISIQVIPIFILIIGIDNMYIIIDARDRVSETLKKLKEKKGYIYNMSNEEQIGTALKEIGSNITIVSFIEILSFFIGYLINIPILQSFCLCGIFSILINYILQITIFIPCISLDDIRIENRKYDLLPCITINENIYVEHSIGKINLQKFISEGYYNLLVETKCKIILIILYLIITLLSIFSIYLYEFGLDQKILVTKNSDLFNYLDTQKKYSDIGPPAFIILYNVNYSNFNNIELINQMNDDLSSLSIIKHPIYFWYKDFILFMNNSKIVEKCNLNKNELLKQSFSNQVIEFLKIKIDSNCCIEEGICGEIYKNDIIFDEENNIEVSRIRFFHTPLNTNSLLVNSIIQINYLIDKYKDKFELILGKQKENNFKINNQNKTINTIFIFSPFYIYNDNYLFIKGISFQNILISISLIFISVQFTINIKASLIIIFFILSCILNLIGILTIINYFFEFKIDVNVISINNIIICFGLCIEFSIHIIIFYIRCNSKDIREKMKYALSKIGISVFFGVFFPKYIGSLFFLFGDCKLFQIYFFRMYFLISIVGIFHSFIILSIILTYINISNNNDNERISKFKEQVLVEDDDE